MHAIAILFGKFVGVAIILARLFFVGVANAAAAEKVEIAVYHINRNFVVVRAAVVVRVKGGRRCVVNCYACYNANLFAVCFRNFSDRLQPFAFGVYAQGSVVCLFAASNCRSACRRVGNKRICRARICDCVVGQLVYCQAVHIIHMQKFVGHHSLGNGHSVANKQKDVFYGAKFFCRGKRANTRKKICAQSNAFFPIHHNSM